MEHSLKSSDITMGAIRKSSIRAHLNVILKKANKFFEDDITRKARTEDLAYYRYIYFYVAKKMFGRRISLTEIGKSVNRDHATVIYGIKRVEDAEKYDKKLYMMLRGFLEYCSIEDDENKDILEFAKKLDIESLTEEVLKLRSNQLSFPILAQINTFLMECEEDIKESFLFKIETIYQLNKKLDDARKNNTTAS
jgi:hypothetical protein